MLEAPDLAQRVQALPGAALANLIAEVGLEDAGELVALATSEQLAEVLDQDLWRSEKPGEDPTFDSDRFLVWLEVMSEAGDRFVADRLAELPLDLLTLAFHRHVLVIALDDLRTELSDEEDDDAVAAEKALASCLSEELEDFQLIWRGGEGWDEVLNAIIALDRDHHSLTVSLLERCAHASREHIDDSGGLYDALTADEMLESDLSAERETRLVAHGFVAPSAAAGFLRLALRASQETPFTEHDPLTRGYFRDLAPSASPSSPDRSGPRPGQLRGWAGLPAPGRQPPTAPLLLGPATPPAREGEPLVISALRELASREPRVFAQRREELAYLANVLVAGASVNGRRLRPVEAVEAAIDCVSFGLALATVNARPSLDQLAEVLARHPCDGLLRLAFARAREAAAESGATVDPSVVGRVRALLKTLKV
ncbi:MAG: hypothetical protein EOO73_09605 [Myxococcales bacterium]|nr:MAG: hypothetical protein EOO73_09605 [Myxococcales bacterium]